MARESVVSDGHPRIAGGAHRLIAGAARELGQQLASLHAALKSLAELATTKLAAMRRADTAELERCAAREEALLREVVCSEQGRRALLARVAQELQYPEPARASLTDLTERLPEPLASSFRARNAALRETALELQRKNRLAAGVAHNLQSHLRGVFAEVAGIAQQPVGYGPQGQQAVGRPRCWVDAVG